jgi:hypothetical protein
MVARLVEAARQASSDDRLKATPVGSVAAARRP